MNPPDAISYITDTVCLLKLSPPSATFTNESRQTFKSTHLNMYSVKWHQLLQQSVHCVSEIRASARTIVYSNGVNLLPRLPSTNLEVTIYDIINVPDDRTWRALAAYITLGVLVTQRWIPLMLFPTLLTQFVYLNYLPLVPHLRMNRDSVGSDNHSSPIRRRAIIWNNARLLSVCFLGANFSEILIKSRTFSFRKIRSNMLFAKWRPFCPEEDGLQKCSPHPWLMEVHFT